MAPASQGARRQPDTEFQQPYAVQPRGSAFGVWLLRRLGWRVHFDGLPTQQGVLLVYPHTSNWDFVVLVLAKWALGVQGSFWGKGSLFDIPLLGRWLRWLGGVPVDQHAPQGLVGQMAERMRQEKEAGRYFWLALSPEGTRKARPGWRTGFYRVAVQTGVPVGLIRLDFGQREVSAVDFFYLSGDEAHDMARLAAVFQGVQGLRPALASPIRLMGKETV